MEPFMEYKMEKYGFVYIWRDRKHKRYYVGSHWGYEDDGYVCSSNWMKNAFSIRPNDFKRKIIARVYSNRKELLLKEEYYLSLIKDYELRLKYYNISKSIKDPWFQHPAKLSLVSQKISVKTKEAMQRPDVRANYEKGLQTRDNKGSDPVVIEKRRQTMIATMAKKFPVENRWQPLSEDERKSYYSNKAKDMHANRSEEKKIEVGKKITQANLGKKMRLGHTNSAEHRENISKGLVGKVHKRHRIMIDGIIYISTHKAADVLDISVATINRRLSNDKYTDYIRLGC